MEFDWWKKATNQRGLLIAIKKTMINYDLGERDMSTYTKHVRAGSTGLERSQPVRWNTDDYEGDAPPRKDSLPNITTEVPI